MVLCVFSGSVWGVWLSSLLWGSAPLLLVLSVFRAVWVGGRGVGCAVCLGVGCWRVVFDMGSVLWGGLVVGLVAGVLAWASVSGAGLVEMFLYTCRGGYMPLAVGSKAPDFELLNEELKPVRLYDVLREGRPVVSLFSRGRSQASVLESCVRLETRWLC